MVPRIELEEIRPKRHVSDRSCNACPFGETIRPHKHHASEPRRSPCLAKETSDPHTHTHQVNNLWRVSNGNFFVAYPTQPKKDLPVKPEICVRPSGLTELHTQKTTMALVGGQVNTRYRPMRRIVRWVNVKQGVDLPGEYIFGRGPIYYEYDGKVYIYWPAPKRSERLVNTVILHAGKNISEETYQEVVRWMRCAGARLGAIQKRIKQKEIEKIRAETKPLEPTYMDII